MQHVYLQIAIVIEECKVEGIGLQEKGDSKKIQEFWHLESHSIMFANAFELRELLIADKHFCYEKH